MVSDIVIPEIIKELSKVTNIDERAALINDACLDIAGMESIQRAIWLKQLAKASGLSQKVLEGKVKDKEKVLKDKKPVLKGEIDPLFYEPELLARILEDVDADHKLDYYEKAALFLIRLTGELPKPSDRKSAALKGDSSSGKDNITSAVLKKFPYESNELLTHTTAAALRKSLDERRCFAFSEINAHREGGANKEIIETFKQLAEGGINAKMCDKTTGELIELKSEQKTLIYGTTEVETDEELHTRYMVIPLHSNREKNETVVNNTLSNAAKPRTIIEENGDNWCSRSIRLLDHELDVIIPYAEMLGVKIKDEDGKEKNLFDYSKPRIMRDVKRLLSLTKGLAWLYQKQRHIIEEQGKKYVVAEPSDFITTYEITAAFFNLTYSGLDHRQEATYKKILELQGKHDEEILAAGYDSQYFGWCLRHKLAEALGIQSVNTIKERIKKLKDFQLVTTHYTYDKPQAYLIQGVSQGVNRVSMPISLTGVTPYLTAYLTPSSLKRIYGEKSITPITWKFWEYSPSEKNNSSVFSKIDTHQIDTLKNTQSYMSSEDAL